LNITQTAADFPIKSYNKYIYIYIYAVCTFKILRSNDRVNDNDKKGFRTTKKKPSSATPVSQHRCEPEVSGIKPEALTLESIRSVISDVDFVDLQTP